MSRPLRIEYPGAWYHVMNRGRRGEKIFSSPDDYNLFLDLCEEAQELWQIKISCYCLMSNDYHLLIHTPLGNLSRSMRHINGVYTQRYNKNHGFDSQLFRGRYKCLLVSNDIYLLEVMRYIHRNPLKAGIVKNLNEYRWSSHSGFMSYAKKWDWLYKDFILAMLSENRSKSIKSYKEFVNKEEPEEIEKFYSKGKLPSILGNIDFIDWVKKEYYRKKENIETSESKQLAPDIKKILEEVCKEYKVEEQKLYKFKRGEYNEARSAAISLIRLLRREKLTDICKIFSLGSYSTASSIILRYKENMTKFKKMKQRYDLLKRRLNMSQT